MDFHCPACSRLLYDRKRKSCGYCGAEIPAEMPFSAAEIEKLAQEMKELDAQLQALREKEEEERERQKAAMDPLLFIPPFLP
ncbi:MAG: hypothetical protein IPL96_15095 [Holophagaceae bacterium]|nr:hypothetical protein [Holophagaceae bacterium]